MKFEARSLGMFEILTVRQDENEVFDADQMLQIVRSLLERDSLQIVIDVSALEYLYSDAINALVSINRRVLERGGHLSLLASQSKIREILLRSGLDSLFRIYKAEGELSIESTEFLRKSTMLAKDAGGSTAYAQAVKAVAPPEGPSTRRLRRRSGTRKEELPRRPVGRQEGNSSVGSSVQGSSGSVAGSSFPSDFVWDETSSSSASDVAPTPEKPLEIYRGIEAPEEPSSVPPPVPPAPQGFFFPPPPQED